MTGATDTDTGYADYSAPVPLNAVTYEEVSEHVSQDSGNTRHTADEGEGGASVSDVSRRGASNDHSNSVSANVSSDRTYVAEYPDFEATHYTAFCDTGCIGITRTGYDVSETIYSPSGRRVIAVDPSVIPLHSIVEVTMEDGTTFEAKALDTGGAIKGRIIDILVPSTEDAWALGRQNVSVKIIRKGGG